MTGRTALFMPLLLVAVAVGLVAQTPAPTAFAIQNARIVTVSGPTIDNGTVVIQDGKIADVGAGVAVPQGARIIDGRGLTVYPGLFDADTTMAMRAAESTLGQFTPELRASTSFEVENLRIPVTRVLGVTHVMVRNARGIIPGYGDVLSLAGWTPDEMALKRRAALVLLFPSVGDLGYTDDERFAVTAYSVTKAQVDRRVREIKEFFAASRAYLKTKEEAGSGAALAINERYEAMIPVLKRQAPVIIEATNSEDIKAAVRFGKEENLDFIIGAHGGAARVADFLKENNVRVLLTSMKIMPETEDDPVDIVYRTPAILHEKGVPFGIATLANRLANPKLLPFDAGNAVAHGLPYQAALRAVTLTPAEFLGIPDLVGSIDKGKVANLVVVNGDILDYGSDVKHLFINGRPVSLDTKDTELYQKYLNRPKPIRK